jgi:hypothetical protein
MCYVHRGKRCVVDIMLLLSAPELGMRSYVLLVAGQRIRHRSSHTTHLQIAMRNYLL